MSAAASQHPLGLPLTLVMTRDGFQVDPNQPMGRQSAGASFLEAYLHYSGNIRHSLVVPQESEGKGSTRKPVRCMPMPERSGPGSMGDAASRTGAIQVPDPGIDDWAQACLGDGRTQSLALCTPSAATKFRRLGAVHERTGPPWDALICTSQAARSVVEGFLERQEAWLRGHNEAPLRAPPTAGNPTGHSPRGMGTTGEQSRSLPGGQGPTRSPAVFRWCCWPGVLTR